MSKLLIIVAVLCLHEAAALGGFLSKKDEGGKKKVHVLDSPAIQKRLEELSGKKVEVEKLKKSFAQDPWASVKTVLGSQPMFNYMQQKRGTPVDQDTKVAGLELRQTEAGRKNQADSESGDDSNNENLEDDVEKANAAIATPPAVELKLARQGLINIYNDYQKNKDTIQGNLEQQMAKEMAPNLRAFQSIYSMMKTGRVIKAMQDPDNAEAWITPKNADTMIDAEKLDDEVSDLFERPENSLDPPPELTKFSDIPDWLENKI